MKRETMLINLTLIHWFHAWERKWKRERKRIEKPFVVLRCIEVNVVIKRVRGRGICGRSPISIRARQTSGRNVRVARVLCRKLHCWILNGAEKLGPPRTFSFLHNSRDWREGGRGTWVARKFAPPDRNDVHLENRISRGAGWANRCIIVVWDCDRGFRRGLQRTVLLCKYTEEFLLCQFWNRKFIFAWL